MQSGTQVQHLTEDHEHPRAIDLKLRIQHTVKEIPVVLSAKEAIYPRGKTE